MATLIASVSGGTGSNGGTPAAINTVGANLIVIYVGYVHTLGTLILTDNQSNTWTPLTEYAIGGGDARAGRIFYCFNPTTNASHTFTTGGLTYPGIAVAAWSGADTSPFDVENGFARADSSSPIQPGSVTPSQPDSIIITGVTHLSTAALSVDSGFTVDEDLATSPGNYFGCAMASLVQTSSSAVNPTWTVTSGTMCVSAIAVFKAVGGGGGATWPGYVANEGWFRKRTVGWRRSKGGLFIPPQVSLV